MNTQFNTLNSTDNFTASIDSNEMERLVNAIVTTGKDADKERARLSNIVIECFEMDGITDSEKGFDTLAERIEWDVDNEDKGRFIPTANINRLISLYQFEAEQAYPASEDGKRTGDVKDGYNGLMNILNMPIRRYISKISEKEMTISLAPKSGNLTVKLKNSDQLKKDMQKAFQEFSKDASADNMATVQKLMHAYRKREFGLTVEQLEREAYQAAEKLAAAHAELDNL